MRLLLRTAALTAFVLLPLLGCEYALPRSKPACTT